ncbi:MAG TPA: ATP-binding protein [Candidatus Limnocylindrales bacterium]|nr:ATP-binding protein [Candidatus Limnocylindrales bacterium]
MTLRRFAPYAVAVGGAIAVTVAIGLVTAVASVSGLSAFYLLLVLWLGARWGRGPAVAGSVAAFLLYDFFFVPPLGTFSVRGPAELLELVVLLAVALVTSQLAASQRRAQSVAEALARDSRSLYELATAMLRTQEVTSALSLVADRVRRLESVARFAVVGVASGQAVQLAGSALTPDELKQALWSYENGKSVGAVIKDGVVVPMRTHGDHDVAAYLPLTSGVVVVAVGARDADDAERRMLAALIGLADLLLERRRATVEAERARGLEASDRLKAAILSSLSHELKSPLASLRAGLTALAAPQAGLQPDQRELLSDLDRQASRLDHMVGDLLALSRLEAGLETEKEAHSFADLVGGSVGQLRGRLQGHDVTVRIPDDLPPVEVDEVQVGRVIGNLLENAIEWASAGGAIEIGALVIDDHFEAWVENEGPAIAVADLEHVFDTFWTTRSSGSGLGLAIARRVVEAHGGTIRAENRRRGPRFTFTLPLARVPMSR